MTYELCIKGNALWDMIELNAHDWWTGLDVVLWLLLNNKTQIKIFKISVVWQEVLIVYISIGWIKVISELDFNKIFLVYEFGNIWQRLSRLFIIYIFDCLLFIYINIYIYIYIYIYSLH